MSVGVRAAGLHFRYPDGDPVLNGVDLTVEPGERVALLGPNGSGKSTFVLHLNGLLDVQAGSLHVGDVELRAGMPRDALVELRGRVGMVFQHAGDQLFLNTVAEDVAFGPANLGLSGAARAERVEAALRAVDGLHLAERSAHHLSGGEQRRAALATVLAMQPDLLVLDEPTADLDPFGRRQLAELLVGLRPTQLIVTHDLPFALATCRRSVILSGGRIVADAPTAELLTDAALLAEHRLELPYGMRLA